MPEMNSLTLNDKTYDCFVDRVAREMASASFVVKSASGESITISDSGDRRLFGLSVYGKTTQDGVPTPDAPVKLVSVGDGGSITVNVTRENESQSITVATPNGLPGIPVDSGGNYTDADGQQWVCDEIDLARGVYIKRCFKEMLTFTYHEELDRYSALLSHEANTKYAEGFGIPLMCETLAFNPNVGNGADGQDGIRISSASPLYAIACNNSEEIEKATVVYPVAIPIETPLSAEEIAAYAALHTYEDHTTVSNDASAYMKVEYALDAKRYIESLIGTGGGGGSPARLSSVTIRASAWKTEEDGLHSQVVTIAGVTPYSKVDLLPSVEQLAIFHNKDVAFVTENEDGVVTVFAIGEKPTNDYTMQVQITEVEV